MSLAIFTAIIGLLLTPNNVHPFLSIFSIIKFSTLNDLLQSRILDTPYPHEAYSSNASFVMGLRFP